MLAPYLNSSPATQLGRRARLDDLATTDPVISGDVLDDLQVTSDPLPVQQN